jgi:CPA1 family monovalent cation:H+ antiporter
MLPATLLVGVAQKLKIPYPIALILGGTAIGFIPGLPEFSFDPSLLLVTVLPPILNYAAYGISFREFKHHWREIFSLALGLVVATTFVIGILFKWIFPQFSWALAFAFGAIVSPPDAIAATTILKRFAIGSRLLSIMEGESLVNDATALVLYRLALGALLMGTFSFSGGVVEFIKVASGGAAIGFVLGFVLHNFSRRFLEPVVGVIFSFTIPYAAYITADFLGVSGVLAVVVVGLVGSQIIVKHRASLRRILGYAAWDIFAILINCLVFILIGLQLRSLTKGMSMRQMILYGCYALLITFVMIAVRMLWVYAKSGIAYFKALRDPKADKLCPQILREAAIIGWSGMRGIVSLAAALALPLYLPNGMPLEGRSEVIIITLMVVLITLLLPGLTLPLLVKWLKIHHHAEHHGIYRVRKQLSKMAQDEVLRLYEAQSITNDELEFLTSYFNLQSRVLEISSSTHKKFVNLEVARKNIINAQRKHLLEMWRRFEIDDKLLVLLEHELDLEETRLARADLR